MTDLKRYERLAFDYAARNPLPPEAIAWHRTHAGETGGPVLELACGTGSLLVPFAEAGHDVVGLDLTEEMLRLARARLEEAPPEVGGRVRLVLGDMARFAFARRFPLVVLADNSLKELETRERMTACLRLVRDHLEPGGRLLLTVRRFDSSRYPGGVAEWPWSVFVEDAATGERARRRIRVEVDEERGRLEGRMTYEVVAKDGTSRIVECPFEGEILEVGDWLAMLADAGLAGTLTVGHSDREDDGKDPILNFAAIREAGRGRPRASTGRGQGWG